MELRYERARFVVKGLRQLFRQKEKKEEEKNVRINEYIGAEKSTGDPECTRRPLVVFFGDFN